MGVWIRRQIYYCGSYGEGGAVLKGARSKKGT